MTAPDLLTAAFAIRLATIVATALSGRVTRVARLVGFAGSAIASAAIAAAAWQVLRSGTAVGGVLLVHAASGFAATYRLDALAAWFLLVLSVIAVPIAAFSIGYFAHGPLAGRAPFAAGAFNVLLGAMELVFVAADPITFLFAWELMTLTNAALVATEHEIRDSRRAAYLFLVMSHLGTACLIAAFFLVGRGAVSRDVLFALFFIGFGVKAGIIPLHVWLPEAHPAAPSSISALMSGVVIKTGIYGIFRFCAFGLGTPRISWAAIVLVLGAVSAALGVLYALMQHDLKRLLAYHSIENIGIILIGLGAGMLALSYGRSDVAWIGVAASLYHVLNHAVFKGLLFLGAGGVVSATGTRQIEEYGGLLRRMPWTAACFLIGAMAISGLPPLNGFASEWLTFQALLFGFRSSTSPLVHFVFPLGAAMLALTTALAAACFVKAFGITFLALPRSAEAEAACESGALMLVPQVALGAACALLGFFPGFVVRALGQVIASLPGFHPRTDLALSAAAMASGTFAFDHLTPLLVVAALIGAVLLASFITRRQRVAVRREPTWGCGGELTGHTEYTATAFSKPIMMIFSPIYRPTRQVETLTGVSPYFPREVRFSASIQPTFERYVYAPLLRAVLRIANGMKVLQAGSVHAYLAYVIALVVTLVLYIWWQV